MTGQKPQRPRQGWIYMINPYRVSLRSSLPVDAEIQQAFEQASEEERQELQVDF